MSSLKNNVCIGPDPSARIDWHSPMDFTGATSVYTKDCMLPAVFNGMWWELRSL